MDQTRGQMDSSVPYTRGTIQTHSNVLWPYKFTSDFSNDDEHDIQMRSARRLVFDFHG
jgi:hypothetical protein